MLTGIANLHADDLSLKDKVNHYRSKKHSFKNRRFQSINRCEPTEASESNMKYTIQTEEIISDSSYSNIMKSLKNGDALAFLDDDASIKIVNIGINAPAPNLRTIRLKMSNIDIDM